MGNYSSSIYAASAIAVNTLLALYQSTDSELCNSCLSLAIDDAEIITLEGLARVAHSINTSEYKSKG